MGEKNTTTVVELGPLPHNDQAAKEVNSSHTSTDTVAVVVDDGNPHRESPDSGPIEVPPPYSVYTLWEKRLIVISAAFSALFASWTAQIYLPALKIAADDLNVSISSINLTVTSYMIFQGLTPIFIGGFADSSGRRPAYLACFVLYLVANIGLAKSDSYGTLLGLRCFQSATISATQALCQGVVADIITSSERGSYSAFLQLPTVTGPSLGPVIGGVIAQYMGWRCIFWFLAICAFINLLIVFCFFPETCRDVVGDGSIRPRKRNQSVWQLAKGRQQGRKTVPVPAATATQPTKKSLGAIERLLASLVLLFEKELGFIFVYSGFVFAGVYAIATAVPPLFANIYGYNGAAIGLMYLPLAAGCLISVAVAGKAMNWNLRRYAARHGLQMDQDRQPDLSSFPIEQARLEVAIPPLILSTVVTAAWGWALELKAPVGVVCVLVFLLGLGLVGTVSTFNALIADVRPGKTSAAAAANNIIKFLLSAAMAAAIEPLIIAVKPGKAFSIIAVLYVIFSPLLFLLMKKGMQWRKEVQEKENRNGS
ncbi:MFS general substrate transporter [Xylariaceae sp. FL0662B]|nr:MFS general substrate transporter [Xylariaceae sp. FL0662B]